MRDKGVVDNECVGPKCSSRGKDAADAAHLEATVSTVGFGVGFAGLITSAIWYAVDRNRRDAHLMPRRGWSVIAISPAVVGVARAF